MKINQTWLAIEIRDEIAGPNKNGYSERLSPINFEFPSTVVGEIALRLTRAIHLSNVTR